MATPGNANTVAEGNVVIRGDLAPVQQDLRTLPAQVGAATDKAQREVQRRGGIFGRDGFLGPSRVGGAASKVFSLLGGAGIVGGAYATGRAIREFFTGEQALRDVREQLFEASRGPAEAESERAGKIVEGLQDTVRKQQDEAVRGEMFGAASRITNQGPLAKSRLSTAFARFKDAMDSGKTAGGALTEVKERYGLNQLEDEFLADLVSRIRDAEKRIADKTGLAEAQRSQADADSRIARSRGRQDAISNRDLLLRIATTLDQIRKGQDEQTDKFLQSQQLSANRFSEGFRELARTARR